MKFKFFLDSDQYVRGRYTFNIEASSIKEAEEKLSERIDNPQSLENAADDFGYLGQSIADSEGWGRNIQMRREDETLILQENKSNCSKVALDHLTKSLKKNGGHIVSQKETSKGYFDVISMEPIYVPEPVDPIPEKILLLDDAPNKSTKAEDHRILAVIEHEKIKSILPKNAHGLHISATDTLLAIY